MLKMNKHRLILLISYEPPEPPNPEDSPIEMGIWVNKTWMDLHNIADINVFFKDPLNAAPFISPKENYHII